MATTLERRVEHLEAMTCDKGPLLIMVSFVSPGRREIGSASLFGEHVSRCSDECEENFRERVAALARSRMRSSAAVVFLNELDVRL